MLHCSEDLIFAFLFWELGGLSPNFHIHVSLSDLYFPSIHPHISCICRSIVGIYKSLIGTWMWKFGLCCPERETNRTVGAGRCLSCLPTGPLLNGGRVGFIDLKSRRDHKYGGSPCWHARMPRYALAASLVLSDKDVWGESPEAPTTYNPNVLDIHSMGWLLYVNCDVYLCSISERW